MKGRIERGDLRSRWERKEEEHRKNEKEGWKGKMLGRRKGEGKV